MDCVGKCLSIEKRECLIFSPAITGCSGDGVDMPRKERQERVISRAPTIPKNQLLTIFPRAVWQPQEVSRGTKKKYRKDHPCIFSIILCFLLIFLFIFTIVLAVNCQCGEYPIKDENALLGQHDCSSAAVRLFWPNRCFPDQV